MVQIDPPETPITGAERRRLASTSLAALGVVFGDIGTSPLYSIRECFTSHGELIVPPTPENILGLASLVLWVLISVVTVKYLLVVLRADNHGEGGMLSLMALVRSMSVRSISGRYRGLALILGLCGAALLYGDGMITPTISVLSAVEGLSEVVPSMEPYILGITIVILIGLFLLQSQGTGRIGFFFGPIILVWFCTIGFLGLLKVIEYPMVLAAFNPFMGANFLVHRPSQAFFMLGSVFLVVTGGEALYADMGHFGRRPIRLAWFLVAWPALCLNYLGQAALLLDSPETARNPFFLLAPEWFRLSLVILATISTVIASQALISGVFSLTYQAIQMGYLPRMAVRHTSSSQMGQVYLPAVNVFLAIATIGLALGFRSSSGLAGAYGMAISVNMMLTSALMYFVMRNIWLWSKARAGLVVVTLLTIECAFVAANSFKFLAGGWFPIVVAAVIFTLMATWRRGRRILASRLGKQGTSFEELKRMIDQSDLHRVPGVAVFMTRSIEGVPPPLVHNLRHNRILHEWVVLLTIWNERIPYVHPDHRLQVENLGEGLYRMIARYGFMEQPLLLDALSKAESRGFPHDISNATFFLGAETVVPRNNRRGMAYWREILFAFMSRNAQRASRFFDLPPERVVEVGLVVEF